VPTIEKVLLKLLPALMFPLSKLLSSPVTVCAMLSLLVHFTVVPADTVIEAGVKAMPAMLTVLDEAGTLLLELLPLEHEINMVKNNKHKLANPVMLLIFFIVFILNGEK
jgi:hypothetical protein